MRLALSLVARDITYSNCLPDWLPRQPLDYGIRTAAVQDKIQKYLDGSVKPSKPYAVLIPRETGPRERWVIPSVNDQIILQACVSSLAQQIDKATDRARMYSYRFNADPSSLALHEDQCDAWKSFETETKRRATSSGRVMFVDLKDAFGHIDRQQFLDFLRPFSKTGVEIEILKLLLDTLGAGTRGLPLMNDSLFFLGSAYFTVVDKVLAQNKVDFVRFMDDYRIFGRTEKEMEGLFMTVNQQLQALGFSINEEKLAHATGEQYCEALAATKEDISSSDLSAMAEYHYSRVPTAQPTPEYSLNSLAKTLKAPDKYLTDEVGRAQLASLRKMRDTTGKSSWIQYAKRLSESADILQSSATLLAGYIHKPEETWRSVWLLYLLKDVQDQPVPDRNVKRMIDETIRTATTSKDVPLVVQLWAKSQLVVKTETIIEELNDLDYETVGQRCYGA